MFQTWLNPLSIRVVIAGLVVGTSSQARADPTLDELQKRLDAAKQSESARLDSERRQSAAKAVADSRMATLVVVTDAKCKLAIDAVPRSELAAGESRTMTVVSGEQLLECESVEFPGLMVKERKTVGAGSKAVVEFALRSQVDDRRREEEAVKNAKEKAAADELSRNRFRDEGDGVLRDALSGLDWMQSDNGSNIDWEGAGRYCAGRGEGWRLPDIEEISGIYDAYRLQETPCGSGNNCRVCPSFRLSGSWFWSSTSNAPMEASYVVLYDGRRGSSSVSHSIYLRALCTRQR